MQGFTMDLTIVSPFITTQTELLIVRMLSEIEIYHMFEISVGKIHDTTGFATLTDSLHNKRFVRGVVKPRLEDFFYFTFIHHNTFFMQIFRTLYTFSARLFRVFYTFSTRLFRVFYTFSIRLFAQSYTFSYKCLGIC